MQLDAIHTFVVVAQCRGYAAAGRRLGLPRSTLSRRIQRLEAELGVRLLDRTTRQVALTEPGRALFERCARSLDGIESAVTAAREAGRQPRGTLRVSAPIDVARDVLAALLPRFRARHPDVELHVEVTQRRTDLIADGIDVALRGDTADRTLPDSSLVARRLARHELALYASATYLDARGFPHSPEDLDRHDLVTFGTPNGAPPWVLHGPGATVRVTPRAWLRVNEFGVVRSAVQQGLGIGPIEPLTAARELATGRLHRVLPAWSLSDGALYAVYPSARRVPPKVRVFVAAMEELLRERGWG
jgi:DNA-binding transcriptional LysR family regulator